MTGGGNKAFTSLRSSLGVISKARAKTKAGPAGPDVENTKENQRAADDGLDLPLRLRREPPATSKQKARNLISPLTETEVVTMAANMLTEGASNLDAVMRNVGELYGALAKVGKH